MQAARSDADGTDGRYFEEKRASLKSYGTGRPYFKQIKRNRQRNG
jgi:hypothetical protein